MKSFRNTFCLFLVYPTSIAVIDTMPSQPGRYDGNVYSEEVGREISHDSAYTLSHPQPPNTTRLPPYEIPQGVSTSVFSITP